MSTETRPLAVIVDDDDSVRRSLSRFLRSAGFDVQTLACACDLLAFEWPAQPTCLVVDIHLPDGSGLALLSQMVERYSHVPVVVITGDADPELRSQALRQGAKAFLTKPFDPPRLLNEIQSALGR